MVLMKERNMLHSTLMLHQKRGTKMPHRQRIARTRKSMAMIKVVLGERQRALDAARNEARKDGPSVDEIRASRSLEGTPF